MSLCCSQNTICSPEQPPQQWCVKPQQGLLLDDIAMPCQHDPSPISGEQARQIRQRERHMHHHHIRLLGILPKIAKKRTGERTGKICPNTSGSQHRNTLDGFPCCFALFLTNQNLYLCGKLHLKTACILPHQRFNTANMRRISFVYQ